MEMTGVKTPKESTAKKSEPVVDTHNQVHTSAAQVNATYVNQKNADNKELHNQLRFKHKKRIRRTRKEPAKEDAASPAKADKAKEDHQKTLHEIKLINDSVAYSPFPVPTRAPHQQEGKEKGTGEEGSKRMEHTGSVSSQAVADVPLSQNHKNLPNNTASQKGLPTNAAFALPLGS